MPRRRGIKRRRASVHGDQKAADFDKKKSKVGRAKVQNTTTNTSFKSRALVIPNQQLHTTRTGGGGAEGSGAGSSTASAADVIADAALDVGPAVSSRGLSIVDLLGKLNHYSENVRAGAVAGLIEIVRKHPRTTLRHARILAERVAVLPRDADAGVRRAALLLARTLSETLNVGPTNLLAPHVPLLLAHTLSAMTHIREDIHIDAVRFLDLWLEFFPEQVVGSAADRVLANFVAVFGTIGSASSAKTSTARQHSSGRGGGGSGGGGSGGSKLRGNPSGRVSRLAVRTRILRVLKTFLEIYTGSVGGSDGGHETEGSGGGSGSATAGPRAAPGAADAPPTGTDAAALVLMRQFDDLCDGDDAHDRAVAVTFDGRKRTVARFAAAVTETSLRPSVCASAGSSGREAVSSTALAAVGASDNVGAAASGMETFVEACCDILFDLFLECEPTDAISGSRAELMALIATILDLLLGLLVRESGGGSTDALVRFVASFNTYCQAYFPLEVSHNGTEEDIATINFTMCGMMASLMDALAGVPQATTKLVGSYSAAIVDFLIATLGGSVPTAALQQSAVRLVVHTLVHAGAALRAAPLRSLLDAFTTFFKSHHPGSSAKRACVHALRLCLSDQFPIAARINRTRAATWLSLLPRLAWDVHTEALETAAAVFDALLAIPSQTRNLEWLAARREAGAGLRAVVGAVIVVGGTQKHMLGPFAYYGPDLQVKVLRCIFAGDVAVERDTLAALLLLVNLGLLEADVVDRLLEMLHLQGANLSAEVQASVVATLLSGDAGDVPVVGFKGQAIPARVLAHTDCVAMVARWAQTCGVGLVTLDLAAGLVGDALASHGSSTTASLDAIYGYMALIEVALVEGPAVEILDDLFDPLAAAMPGLVVRAHPQLGAGGAVDQAASSLLTLLNRVLASDAALAGAVLESVRDAVVDGSLAPLDGVGALRWLWCGPIGAHRRQAVPYSAARSAAQQAVAHLQTVLPGTTSSLSGLAVLIETGAHRS